MKMHIKVTCTINMQKLIKKLNQIKPLNYHKFIKSLHACTWLPRWISEERIRLNPPETGDLGFRLRSGRTPGGRNGNSL